ncbi:BamA/TamA family outer membrane protein [Formosa sp. 3Alg 14/1]|uniref:BamA/TamA family outer membrane protein n=1 Tax=Formosa sp. 3Alg 14/1 TaxID=3382190 RepID=UPI0039BE290E
MKYFYVILFLCSLSTFAQDSIDEQKGKAKAEKKVKTVIIPTITYNNSFGTMFGAMGSGFYKLNPKDTISPISKSMIIGTYSTNKTWMVIIPNTFYFNEDKQRAKFVVGTGSVNFQTYVDWGDFLEFLPDDIFNVIQPEGEFVGYNNSFQFAFAEFVTEVYKKLYVGGHLLYSHNLTDFDTALKKDEENNLFGFGLASVYDTRDNQMRPLTGMNAKLSTMHFLTGLGSTSNYSNINMEYNKYYPMQETNTMLLRGYAQIAIGDVPFSGQNVVGRDDLRGYSNGKFRADQVYDVQTEYRHALNNKWGYVAFAGLATAINTVSDISLDNTLPAMGAGIRYLAIPKANINIGFDAAVGRDDWGVYFRIGEAFTR